MTKKLFILVILVLAAVPALAEMTVDTAWVRRYSYGYCNGVAMDGSGNVYVSGTGYHESGGNYDFTTIKYDSDGTELWVRTYNGPGNSYDGANAITVDASGHIYVTGYCAEDSVYPYNYDYTTIKYYPNGDTAWVRRYDGPANKADVANAIAVDDVGNVYVTGESEGIGTFYDFATIKYNPNGDTAWVRRYNGPENYEDKAAAIVVDGLGNACVVGESNHHCTTIKYDQNGVTMWSRRYSNGGYGHMTVDLAVDGFNNVCVTGESWDDGQASYDYVTTKYSPGGDTVWMRIYNGPGNSWDYPRAITVDNLNNIYVSGWSWDDSLSYDYATIKYIPNGDTAWVRRYNGPGNYYDGASALTTDGYGNIYVTGVSTGSGTEYDFATIKYSSNGETIWLIRYNGPGDQGDVTTDLAANESGVLYVTGQSGSDYTTVKYVQFLCGDANKDSAVDVGDVVYLINYLFKNGPSPVPILKAGDASCDGVVDVGDVVYLINYLFKNGPEPCC